MCDFAWPLKLSYQVHERKQRLFNENGPLPPTPIPELPRRAWGLFRKTCGHRKAGRRLFCLWFTSANPEGRLVLMAVVQ